MQEKNEMATSEQPMAFDTLVQQSESTGELDLSGIELTNGNLFAIQKLLGPQGALHTLKIRSADGNERGRYNTGLLVIARTLAKDKRLEELDLRDMLLTDQLVAELAVAIKHSKTLKRINLANCAISREGTYLLIDALQTNTAVTDLNLSHNDIGNELTKHLLTVLQHNKVLHNLGLSHLNIEPDLTVAQAFAQLLTTSTSLKKLDLSANQMEAEGLTTVVAALQSNTSLTELSMAGLCAKLYEPVTSLSLMHANRIAAILCQHPSLTHLDLGYNFFDDAEVMNVILSSLINNQTLTHLGIQCCAAQNVDSGHSLSALRQLILETKTLKSLNLSDNAMDDDELADLAVNLAMNTSLEFLDLRFIAMEDDEMDEIFTLFTQNEKLTDLKISESKVGSSTRDERLAIFLTRNRLLTYLKTLATDAKSYPTDSLTQALSMVLNEIETIEARVIAVKARMTDQGHHAFVEEVQMKSLYKNWHALAEPLLKRLEQGQPWASRSSTGVSSSSGVKIRKSAKTSRRLLAEIESTLSRPPTVEAATHSGATHFAATTKSTPETKGAKSDQLPKAKK